MFAVGPVRASVLLAVLASILWASAAGAQEADLVVSKSGPAQAAADSDVTYTVSVLNGGPDTSASITLTDPIPPGMTFVSASPAGCSTPAVGSNGLITCTIPSLAALATANFTFVFHIAPATPPGTFFTNVATAASATDPNSENNSGVAVTQTPPPPQADMGVAKTGPSTAGPNINVVYTIVVTNGGPDAASSVTLTDPLPAGAPPSPMTFVSLTQSGTPLSCATPAVGSGGTVSCTAASYPAGGTTTLTLTGHIPAGTASDTTFTNSVTVSSTTADPNPENTTSNTIVTVSSVDVSVVKQGPPTANAGDNISYALLVANGGPDVAANVTFSDPLPPNTTFVSFVQDTGPVATCSTPAPGGTGTVTCNWAALASMASAQFTLVIKVGNTTSVTNTASVTTDSFDTDQSNNSSITTTSVNLRADVGISKVGPASATAGANVTYTLTATNSGPSDAASVSITDTVVAPLTFVSLNQTTGPTFACVTPAPGGTGTITCTIATLPAGASATFSLVLRTATSTPAGGSASNTANIGTTTVDANPDNNSSTTTATVATSADVSVTKSASSSASIGTAAFTITVTNAGPSNAANVTLSDTLPAGTTFASETQTTGPAFTCVTPAPGATGTITCTIATLAAGATATFNIVLNVPPGSSFTNTAIAGTTTSDPNSANNSSTASVTPPAGIPTLSPAGFALLGLLLAVAGLYVLRRRRPARAR